MTNNKRLGSAFEREMCELLAKNGYWAHLISPDARGAQPFDIIAAKNGRPFAIDCKTTVTARFPLSRLEDNQVLAFRRWMQTGNGDPWVAIKYRDRVYVVSYPELDEKKVVELTADRLFRGEL